MTDTRTIPPLPAGRAQISSKPAEAASLSKGWARAETIDRALFWAFLAGLAWVPFFYGGNDLTAWGINAVLFPGLALIYEVSILVRRQPHPVGIAAIGVPSALFGIVAVWIYIQNATWTPSSCGVGDGCRGP
jgi:hypothetical protein